MTTIQNTSDLLNFLVNQANSGSKSWFGFQQQKIAGINLAYQIAIAHADKLSPEDVVNYVVQLNNVIYSKMLKG
jgi:hypothetical protein